MAADAAVPGPRSAPDAGRAIGGPSPGPLLAIGEGAVSVDIAPQAGGRIAQIRRGDVGLLVGYGEGDTDALAWGSYPMVPWAGRTRGGRFAFRGHDYHLPVNEEGHAVHGVGYAMPWRVDDRSPERVDLSLQLPGDARWPFGGVARQRIEVGADRVRMRLSITAGAQAMPAALGWHPWFRKPERVDFAPSAVYPRDAEGIATVPPVAPTPGPWDDCFLNREPVVLHLQGQVLRLTSDCVHWVVYDEPAHATCVEPQSGPPDGLNLAPARLAPGASLESWFLIEWL